MKRAMSGPHGMTKAQALRQFRVLCSDETFMMNRSGRTWLDSVARDEAWKDYTDGLCEDGRITREQCDGWTSPWK